jgi:hypothetical protein
MKKILSLLICIMVFGSIAMAIPHPKYRNQNKARVASGKTLPPKPEVRNR